MLPRRRKDPQVDLVADHDACALAQANSAISADLLVHHAFVAGQRHHLADLGQSIQDGRDVAGEADCPRSNVAGDELDFGEAELLG